MDENSSPLLDFMQRLSEDADLRERLDGDPEAVLAESGLSDEAADAVRSKSNAAVRAQIATELGTAPQASAGLEINHVGVGWTSE